jgi:succinate dehydrogenase / fumarate reductase iron-sulfur subunit
MRLILEIERFNSETDENPYLKRYEVEAAPTDRVLDVLMHIERFQDATLTFRRSCAHGVCGSDAMVINGKERLACKTLVREVAERDGTTIRIEPLRGFVVERDLMVDQAAFFGRYQLVKPFLINDEPVEKKERRQSPDERRAFDDATNCILCWACFSACPVMKINPNFLGPAVIAQASRFLDDSRDQGFEARLPVIDSPNGIWPCENHFECTRACPRGVKITKRINETKRRVKKYREEGEHTDKPTGNGT